MDFTLGFTETAPSSQKWELSKEHTSPEVVGLFEYAVHFGTIMIRQNKNLWFRFVSEPTSKTIVTAISITTPLGYDHSVDPNLSRFDAPNYTLDEGASDAHEQVFQPDAPITVILGVRDAQNNHPFVLDLNVTMAPQGESIIDPVLVIGTGEFPIIGP